MGSFLQFLSDAGFIGWCIILTGIAGSALVVERSRVLFGRYGMDAEEFMKKVQTLVLAKKAEEALILCNQLEGKPLADACKSILERADRDDDAIFQAHDNSLAENVPLLTKRLHYLSMLANVATLLGLLGTIHGLILSFQAVAQADPAQKQAMLAHGISVSMYTTALGLVVAIPAMVAYSFLVSRQNLLLEQITEKTGKLTELLTTGHMPTATQGMVFPSHLKADGVQSQMAKSTPPPSGHKAS
jgi:biopolymer transport protein ExbB/TolQ